MPRRTLPVAEEELHVSKRKVATGVVRVSKRTLEREEEVEQPLVSEHAEVARVPVDRVLDVPEQTREEDGWLVIPVQEEVLVRRWHVREEVRVRRVATQQVHRERVRLKTEEVHVDRTKAEGGDEGDPEDR